MVRRIWAWISRIFGRAKPKEAPVGEDTAGGIRHVYSIRWLLKDLPEIFRTLGALKMANPDAYGLFSKIGAPIAESPGSGFAVAPCPDFLKSRPHGRAVFFKGGESDDGIFNLAGAWLLRVEKIKFAGAGAVIPFGLTYELGVMYRAKNWRRNFSETAYVSISPDGTVQLLPERRVSGYGRKRDIHRVEWKPPAWPAHLAADPLTSVQSADEAITLFVGIVSSAKCDPGGILVRASDGDSTAAWSIGHTDGKRFFKDRVTGKASDGRRKRILHHVQAFTRATGQKVRAHYRGEREFTWNGYSIKISVPGWHHSDFLESDVAATVTDAGSNAPGMTALEVGKVVSGAYDRPFFLSKKSRGR